MRRTIGLFSLLLLVSIAADASDDPARQFPGDQNDARLSIHVLTGPGGTIVDPHNRLYLFKGLVASSEWTLADPSDLELHGSLVRFCRLPAPGPAEALYRVLLRSNSGYSIHGMSSIDLLPGQCVSLVAADDSIVVALAEPTWLILSINQFIPPLP